MTAQLARPVATAIQRYGTLCIVHAHMQGNKLSTSLCYLCVCTKCRKLSAALKPTFLSVVDEVRPVYSSYLAMRMTHARTWTSDLMQTVERHETQSHKHAGHAGNPSGAPDAETHFRCAA
jgi:stress-induced morphogen